MYKEEKKQAIVGFVASHEYNYAAPPKVIHHNLHIKYDTDPWTLKTTRNLIDELVDDGELERSDVGRGWVQEA